MKFVVEQAGRNGGRLGKLSGIRSQPTVLHDTPLAVVSTLGGSAPHLTQDVLHLVVEKDVPVCFPAQNFCELTNTLQKFKKGVAHFSALKTHSTCMTVQNALKVTPSGYNEKKGVSLWSYGGRNLITCEKYMELVEAMQPDWFEALNDADTDVNSSKKRITKSMLHSTALLEKCLDMKVKLPGLQEAGLFAPLLGGHSEDDRRRWSKAMADKIADKDISGFSLLGIHTNGSTTEQIEVKQLSKIISSSLEPLPKDLPRQAFGAWNPLAVITLAQEGIDLFDSSFPTLVTERRGALVFPTNLDKRNHEDNLENSENLEHQNKKLRSDSNLDTSNDSKTAAPEDEGTSPYEITLKDKRFFASTKPLLENCKCYTCKNFTCSYIHHLINVNELLGPVLLMVHNLHHWMTFFTSIRTSIRDHSLEDLKLVLEEYVSGSEKT